MSQPTNPWKILSSHIAYSHRPWLAVREHQVVKPNGSHGLYSVIETRPAVGVVAISSEREVYLVGQYRFPINDYSWEIIEGGSEEGESPLETAKRELREEAGLIANTWRPLSSEIHLSNCFTDEKAYLFLAEDLQTTDAAPDDTEILTIKKVPLTICCKMALSGEISDALSIIGVLQASLLLS